MTYLRKLIEGNQCKELSLVDVHFDRREYQSKDSRGNRYHVHVGFNTKNMSLSDLRKIICSSPSYMFAEEHNTTYPQLLALGVISCYKEFCYVKNIITASARHWCSLTNDRCKQQKGPNSELVCRVRNRPRSSEDYFLETHNIYSEEANKILIDLNLAHYKD